MLSSDDINIAIEFVPFGGRARVAHRKDPFRGDADLADSRDILADVGKRPNFYEGVASFLL